ncbi:MAG: recombinase family protein [Miniphocaeibacter sp.]|uniref:recombinase family protein n=1 Tax=Miniphocaeibacter sp. TaxID=3100973 RepID=UPI0018087A67|nr:recombinase family protein [Gallicola sp.]
MKKAVAYARFSSDNQREESIDAQLRAIEEYAQRNNILLIDKYIDKLYEHLTTTISGQEKEFLVLKEQLKKLDTEEEVLNNAILNGVMNQGIVDKNNSIQKRKKAIGEQLLNFKTYSIL